MHPIRKEVIREFVPNQRTTRLVIEKLEGWADTRKRKGLNSHLLRHTVTCLDEYLKLLSTKDMVGEELGKLGKRVKFLEAENADLHYFMDKEDGGSYATDE